MFDFDELENTIESEQPVDASRAGQGDCPDGAGRSLWTGVKDVVLNGASFGSKGSQDGAGLRRVESFAKQREASSRLLRPASQESVASMLGDKLCRVFSFGALSLLSTDSAVALEEDSPGAARDVRIWAMSDIHVDIAENMAWLRGMDLDATQNDILILAGDVGHELDHIRETLRECTQRYSKVFFCAGNHDLWLSTAAEQERHTSIDKLRCILDICREHDVEYGPCKLAVGVKQVLVVPFQSWHHPQWDSEPDIDGWDGLEACDKILSDYALTRWPESIGILDGSAALAVDSVNDEVFSMDELMEARAKCQAVISFSHFVPRLELNPEKRYLTRPNLAKGVGSDFLRRRVEELQPDVHIFGHTHFGFDMVVDDVRYIQAPLAYPAERQERGTTVAVGAFPPTSPPEPLRIWSSRMGWAPRSRSAWSEYYMRYERNPSEASLLPSYVADGLKPARGGPAKVGWPPGHIPTWLLGQQTRRASEALSLARSVRELQCRPGTCAGRPLAGQRCGLADGQPLVREPETCEAGHAVELFAGGRCAVVDIREDASGLVVQGSIALPHPERTEAFPSLPDKELYPLVDRLMIGRPLIVIGGRQHVEHECRHAAMLLTAFLRIWPQDVLIVRGGIDSWLACGGPVESAPR